MCWCISPTSQDKRPCPGLMTWKMTNRNQYLNVSGREDWRLCRMFTSKAHKFSLVSKPSLLSTDNLTTSANKFHNEREKNIHEKMFWIKIRFQNSPTMQLDTNRASLRSNLIAVPDWFLCIPIVYLPITVLWDVVFYFLVFALSPRFALCLLKNALLSANQFQEIFSCILLRQLHVPTHWETVSELVSAMSRKTETIRPRYTGGDWPGWENNDSHGDTYSAYRNIKKKTQVGSTCRKTYSNRF